MASIHKESIREKFDLLKSEFKDLSSKGKVSPEINILINGFVTIMELLIVIFLEKETKKNPKNSSIPPSQTEEDNTIPDKGKGSKGKGKDHNSTQADNTRTIETTTIIPVNKCSQCKTSLKHVECECIERRTRIDILFEKSIENFDIEVKLCPTCDETTKAVFPKDLHGPLQYGMGLMAYVVELLVSQMVSLKRTQGLVKAMLGKKLSEATFLAFIMRLYLALDDWENQAKKAILTYPCMNTDETSLRVDKKNHWIHVCSAGDITLKFLHKSRGNDAIKDINIIPLYHGVLVHDCWSSYLSYIQCDHGLCGSHILRELAFVIESNGYTWAEDMAALLKNTCARINRSKKKRLSKNAYAALEAAYRKIIRRGKKELPEIPPKPSGQRGKMAKSDAHNLWERLKYHEKSVLRFSKDKNVSFTNNRAERDLRMAKVKQKISGCFRTEKYAKAYCRISSYLQTMSNKGINPLLAIQMAFKGEFKI